MVKSFCIPSVGNVFIESNQPSVSQLAAANQHPGLLDMMPTHAAVISSVCWNIYKRTPRVFDTTPFVNSDGAIVIDERYNQAAEAFKVANLTGDSEIDDSNDGVLVVALKSSLDEDQVEHGADNTGLETHHLVCLEFIGCESSSENLHPDHQYTSSKTAFTDKEIERIILTMELLARRGQLP